MEVIPPEFMPPGNQFFLEEDREQGPENYPTIVHNNYVYGHVLKKERFIDWDMWKVDDLEFPTC